MRQVRLGRSDLRELRMTFAIWQPGRDWGSTEVLCRVEELLHNAVTLASPAIKVAVAGTHIAAQPVAGRASGPVRMS